MMRGEVTFERAVELAAHFIAVGQSTIYLYGDDADIPAALYQLATEAQAGGSYRLSGPASVRFAAEHPSGLSFEWSVDFESREANGSGVSQFDRDKLRGVIRKLNPEAAQSFAAFLEREVLPPLKKRTDEIRETLNKQEDSYDCALGLIAYAKELSDA